MKTYTTKVEKEEVYFVTLPEEFGFEPGQKFTIEPAGDGFILKPFVEIEVDLDDHTFMELSKMAHEQDITFNELCNNILREQLEKNAQ